MRKNMTAGYFAILLILFAFFPVQAAKTEGNQPEIFISKLRHDFGTVFEIETFKHEFMIRNKGKADLVINRVKPG